MFRTVSTTASMIMPPVGRATVDPATITRVSLTPGPPSAAVWPVGSVPQGAFEGTPSTTAAAQFPSPSTIHPVISKIRVSGSASSSTLKGRKVKVSVRFPVRAGEKFV